MHPAFSRHEGRWVFDGIATTYADARPPYPERVYEILRTRCHLGPGQRVLDIGAGSGQATQRLVDAGAEVVAVEPSQALADELRARLNVSPSLQVVVGPFEDVDLPSGAFDLVTAATSFHWLDADRAVPMIARVLRPGGWLALWWNVFGDPELPDPFHDATLHVLKGLAPSPSAGDKGVPFALDVGERVSDLTSRGFEDVKYEAMRWTLRLNAPGTRRLYETYSNIARVPDADRRRILDEIERIAEVEFGGHVDREMVTPIYTAHASG
jgi:SAM-dependent methyltransferase